MRLLMSTVPPLRRVVAASKGANCRCRSVISPSPSGLGHVALLEERLALDRLREEPLVQGPTGVVPIGVVAVLAEPHPSPLVGAAPGHRLSAARALTPGRRR